MSYYVYILQSEAGSYYVGCTQDIGERIAMHNSGRVKSTKAKKPWVLRASETYSTLSEARQREAQIKQWKSRVAIESLITALSSNG